MRLYEEMVANYPFVIIEDPLDENDYEGHAELTQGSWASRSWATTSSPPIPTASARAWTTGAANTMLLKVYQIGTITEAFEAVQHVL